MKTNQMNSPDKVTVKSLLGQNKGQLIIEYVLLIFVVAAAAVLLSSLLVSRADGDEGVIILLVICLQQSYGCGT